METFIYHSSTQEEEVMLLSGEDYQLPNGNMANQAGSYTSILTSHNGCDSIIITHLDFTTSTQSNSKGELEWLVFPNPTSDNFTIKIPSNTETYQVNIFNSLSQKIYTQTLNSILNINAENWAEGIYHIYIYEKKGKVVGVDRMVKIR